MKLPYSIAFFPHQNLRSRWISQFTNNGQEVSEGAWVRTQEEVNRDESKKFSPEDSRMRIIYFRDEYDISEEKGGSSFILKNPYLFLYYALPEEEMDTLKKKVSSLLEKGGWRILEKTNEFIYAQKGDLIYKSRLSKSVDERSRIQDFPNNYFFNEMKIFSQKNSFSREIDEKPWSVLRKGIRKRDIPERGRRLSLEELLNFFPAHMEIGAGASVSSGVPALHFLHTIYSLKDENGRFLFDSEKDTLLFDILSQPEVFYQKASRIHRKALVASLNSFYQLMHLLKEKNLIIEPVYVNNFDGFLPLAGIASEYVRRIASTDIAKNIHFHPDAKSLIVVGVHADRRKIQKRAREAGLPVIYIDPEGFHENGDDFAYPLESIQSEDFHIPMRADDFAENLGDLLSRKNL